MTLVRNRRKLKLGRVISDKMDKTVIVAVERRVHHRLYRKSLRKITKFKAHDIENTFRVGDLVRIIETRPLSRTKQWRVVELVDRKETTTVPANEVLEEKVEEVLKITGNADGETLEASEPDSNGPEASADSETTSLEAPVETESAIKDDQPTSPSADQSDLNAAEQPDQLNDEVIEEIGVEASEEVIEQMDEENDEDPRKGAD